MYRCIIFTSLYPIFLDSPNVPNHDRQQGTVTAEDSTPECAMVKAAEGITSIHLTHGLRSRLTWQPASGRVYFDGKVCGVVFYIESPFRRDGARLNQNGVSRGFSD